MSENDFGFSIVDEIDITTPVEYEKAVAISDIIMPLLNNLTKNPEKDIIKWPGKNRVDKISEIKDEIKSILSK